MSLRLLVMSCKKIDLVLDFVSDDFGLLTLKIPNLECSLKKLWCFLSCRFSTAPQDLICS